MRQNKRCPHCRKPILPGEDIAIMRGIDYLGPHGRARTAAKRCHAVCKQAALEMTQRWRDEWDEEHRKLVERLEFDL